MPVKPDFRKIPSVDRLLGSEGGQLLLQGAGRELLVQALREATDELRGATEWPDLEQLESWLLARAERSLRPRLQRVVNATGVVLHTNLGRAPLAAEAIEHIQQTAGGYCNLEFDVESGKRGQRMALVESYLTGLTGAEAAVVVNNCAAAMLLILDTFAAGKEVVVSRGELVEIGGSYRVPDILERSRARLVEVGTTNRTRLADFESAITQDTGVLLSTHPSNYRVVGFTESVPTEQLAQLGRERGILTVYDLGSGLMSPLFDEPTVAASICMDLVAFSGDKLLGGPQAGIVVGRAELVGRLRKSPLMRALRVDKLVFAALEATLRLHQGERHRLPIWHAIERPLEELEVEARRLQGLLAEHTSLQVDVEQGSSSIGGGSIPGQELPTWLVRVRSKELTEEALAARLREHRPAVVCRRSEGALLLDPRTLFPGDYPILAEAFA